MFYIQYRVMYNHSEMLWKEVIDGRLYKRHKHAIARAQYLIKRGVCTEADIYRLSTDGGVFYFRAIYGELPNA